jgi:hypothetical protein
MSKKPTNTTTQLPSHLDHTPEELAHAGASFNAAKLADGARTRLAFAREDAGPLAEWGFDAAWRDALEHQVLALAQEQSSRALSQSAARPVAEASGQAAAALHAWVKQYGTAVELSLRQVQSTAPHAAHGWQKSTHLGDAAQPLVTFADNTAGLKAPGGHKAFAAKGQAAIDAYLGKRTAHLTAVKGLPQDVQALHQAEGIVALELQRLAKAAKSALGAERAKLYATAELRSGSHGRAKAGPVGPAPEPSPAT